MPCGGIQPFADSGTCLYCNKPGAHHFCYEWACWLHARCVPDFLKTEEGQVVIKHEHQVVLRFDLENSAEKVKKGEWVPNRPGDGTEILD